MAELPPSDRVSLHLHDLVQQSSAAVGILGDDFVVGDVPPE